MLVTKAMKMRNILERVFESNVHEDDVYEYVVAYFDVTDADARYISGKYIEFLICLQDSRLWTIPGDDDCNGWHYEITI